MQSNLFPELKDQLKNDHREILQFLKNNGYKIQELPPEKIADNNSGESFAIAYPIQGLLKYHGLMDAKQRIAFFPSISLNNDSAFSVTYVQFDNKYSQDHFILNGKEQKARMLVRIQTQLDFIRDYAKIRTKALVISRNINKSNNTIVTGKGLGTSASGGAALTQAAFSILYDNPLYAKNSRLLSIYSRYLAGSASRSSVGGIGLWLNHPSMTSSECFAIRLDTKSDSDFINNIDLITVSIPAEIKTDQAHQIAVQSPFYPVWLKNRKSQILEFLKALKEHNFKKIGELTEYDTLCLHAVTMTGTKTQNFIVWAPITLQIMHQVRHLRKKGIPAYFSIDTGPSVVILTLKKFTPEILTELDPVIQKYQILLGKIGGPSKVLNQNSSEAELLKKDIEQFRTGSNGRKI